VIKPLRAFIAGVTSFPEGAAAAGAAGLAFLTLLISFSNFMAKPMFPLILSFPHMNAVVAFIEPSVSLLKTSVFNVRVQSTLPSNAPDAKAPFSFFKSKYHSAGEASVMLNE